MSKELIIYRILCVCRIALTLIPQWGYIHPDEHFQGPEIAYGDLAQYKVLRTWDFSSAGPIRSIIFPYSVTIIPAIIIRLLTSLHFKATSYLLLVLPRLLMCMYSFLQDICIYQICLIMKIDYKPSLILFASSYVTLSYCSRTFSNSLESILLALFLFFMVKSLKIFQEVFYNENNLLFDETYNHFQSRFTFYSFINSVIVVWGCFIRPTFICFTFFPMIAWCFVIYRVNIYTKINILLSIILGVSSMSMCIIAIDTFYYNKIHYSTIKNVNFICTPINFISYNLNPTNLSNHGLHPQWLHLLINVPLLFSVYGIILLFYCMKKIYCLLNILSNYFEMLLFLSFVGPLILLSAIPHQEPRFIISLIIPLSLFYNFKYFRSYLSKKNYIYTWICSNIFCLIFYGFIHQAGVYLSISYLNNVVEQRNVVIFYKNYMPPRYLFHLNENSRTCGIYDFTEHEIDEFELRMQDIILNNKPSKVFIVLPHMILNSDLTFEALTMSNYKFVEKVSLFPHLSTENLPTFSLLSDILQKNSSLIHKLYEVKEIFSIHIISFQKYFN